MALSSLDLVLIAAYAAVLLAIGLLLRRPASVGLNHYLLADRRTSWWMLGVSGVMDFWDLAGSIVIVTFLFLLGPAGLFVEFRGGAVLLLAVVMLWTGKWRRRSGCMTGADWMRFRFGDGPAGRLAQSARAIGGIALFIGLVAYATKALGVFLSSLLPLTPQQSAFAVVTLVAAYSVFSGFYGLVAIQVLQFGCVLVSAAALVILAVNNAPSSDRLTQMAIEVTGNSAWGSALPGRRVELPPAYDAYEPLLFLATLYLVRNVLFGMGAGDDPKCFAARRDVDCPKLALLWTSLMALRWPTMMAFAVLAIGVVHEDEKRGVDWSTAAEAIRTEYFQGDPADARGKAPEWSSVVAGIAGSPDQQPTSLTRTLRDSLGENWPRRLADINEDGRLELERLVPMVLERAVPPGLRGLVLVSLLAAATAGLSGWLNQAAGLFAKDVYLVWLRPSASTREQIVATWAMVIGVVVLGYSLAFSAQSVNDIWSWLTMGLGSGMIFAQLLPLYWRRFNGVGFTAGLAGGVLAAAAQRIAAPYLPESLGVAIGEGRLLFLVSAAGLGASLLATWFSPPTSDDVLARFYLRTLPFGAWSTERNRLKPKHREQLAACHRREIATLPIALTYQVSLFLAPMLAIIGRWGPTITCAAIAAASLLALWFAYFRFLESESRLVAQIGEAHGQTVNAA